MINYQVGNLFEFLPEKYILVHGANAQGKMGAGFAKEFKNRFPNAYNDYLNKKTYALGEVIVTLENGNIIVSAITQQYYGRDSIRYVSYDAVDRAMRHVSKLADEFQYPIYMPFIGAGLGGGNENILSAIFEEVFWDNQVYIFKLEN